MIEQIWITVFGCSAVWFVGRTEKWNRIGYILGLISQPAWIYTAVRNEQWGILMISIWYTYAWGQGVYCHWIKKQEAIK